MQVKRPMKIDKYHLKILQDTHSKIPAKELHKSKVQVNKKRKDIKLLVICFEIPHTQKLHHVATNRLNFDTIQIAGFCNTRDNRAGNLTTDSSNKSQ